MAAVHATTSSILSSSLHQFVSSARHIPTRSATLYSRRLAHPLLSSVSFSVPAIHLNVPTLLGDLWDSVLRAVPKKKTSYSKKRSRFMAGKALKDVKALSKCPACGHTKRSHLLCSFCVKGKLFVAYSFEKNRLTVGLRDSTYMAVRFEIVRKYVQ
jgi:large subunit ribosomal protein L32